MIFSENAEQAVIGGLLLQNDAFDRLGPLTPEHFYRGDHRAIFAETQRLLEAGQPVDVVTLSDRLKSETTVAYLHELAANTPSAANIGRYAEIVRRYAQRRQLGELAKDLQSTLDIATIEPAQIIDRAQRALEQIAHERQRSEPVKAADDMPQHLAEIEARARGEGPKAIPTGFVDLDRKMNGGIRPGDLIIVAARPKMGKSAFAFNVAMNVALTRSVLILSMEMPRSQIHDRNLAAVGRLDLGKVIDPRRMDEADWPRLARAAQKIEAMNLILDDQGALRMMDVRLKARAVRRKYGLDLLIIDYLQLMEGEGDTRNAQIEGITRGLKALAKELGIGIVLLSQLNRQLELRPNKRPMPSDLRDSGAIEQDCDAALFLYRDEVYNDNSPDAGICEVNVGLIRQGERGRVGLAYVANQTRFENLEGGREFGQTIRVKYSGLKD